MIPVGFLMDFTIWVQNQLSIARSKRPSYQLPGGIGAFSGLCLLNPYPELIQKYRSARATGIIPSYEYAICLKQALMDSNDALASELLFFFKITTPQEGLIYYKLACKFHCLKAALWLANILSSQAASLMLIACKYAFLELVYEGIPLQFTTRVSFIPPIQYNASLLMDYQQEGISWMLDLYRKGLGGVLASEPGLGKTRQACAFLLQLQKLEPSGRPVCVIAPNSLVLQWDKEMHKYLFEEDFASLQSQLGHPDSASALITLYSEQTSQLCDLAAKKERLQKKHFKTPAKRKKELDEVERKTKVIEERQKRCRALILQAIDLAKLPQAIPHLQHRSFTLAKTQLAADSNALFSLLESYPKQYETQRKEIEAFFAKVLNKKTFSAPFEWNKRRNPVVLYSQDTQQLASQIISCKEFSHSGNILISSESSIQASTELASRLAEIPFACVIIDEAHTFRWKLSDGRIPKTGSAKTMMQLLSSLSTSFNTRGYLLTGTPFVNSYDETLSLLQLANPHLDLAPFAGELQTHASKLSRSLARSQDSEEELVINPANYFLALEYAREIHNKLILVHQARDEKIQAAWTLSDNTLLIPQKDEKPLVCTLTDEQQQLFASHDKKNPILFNPLAEKILFHPDLLKSEGFDSTKELQAIINGSGLLQRLFQGELDEAMQTKQPTVFFVRQKVIGKTLKMLLKKKYASVAIGFYNGSKTQSQRDSLVQRFEDPENPLKILILSQEAGGVGLNLPSAKVVFDLAPWWNEAVTMQAHARAIRAGTSGMVKVYSISCQTPYEASMQYIVQRKMAWKEYYFGNPQDPFTSFVQAVSNDVARDLDTSEKLLETLKTCEAPEGVWHMPKEACIPPPRGEIRYKELKMQLLPLFSAGRTEAECVNIVASIMNDSSKQAVLRKLLVFLKTHSSDAWTRLWQDPHAYLSTVDEVNKPLAVSWFSWLQHAAVCTAVYNCEVYTYKQAELELLKSERKNGAFTVRLLKLQDGSYAALLRL
jgi:SNF2 family DNA or RNA helicase